MNDVLTPEEIKEIRGLYGLTQKSFAQLLGLGTASIVRYEQGVAPSKANANLIRAARHPQFVKECLKREGDSLPQQQREKATRVVYALISLDPEEGDATMKKGLADDGFLTDMDRVYHYTLQQEVLNEQAANLACDIMTYMMSHNIDSNDKSHPVSILLKQLLGVKKEIVSETSDDDLVLEQMRGYLNHLESFLAELNRVAEVA